MSKKDYISAHPELKSSSQKIQDKRYEHAEQKCLELIDNLKQLRLDMIKAEEETHNTTGNKSKEGNNTINKND